MLDDLLKTQYEHFKLNYRGHPRELTAVEEKFRVACMLEEITEFVLADDLIKKYDALLDLIIFAAGTLHRMGLPIDKGLREVVNANLTKQVGTNSKRGDFALDLIKPDTFEPADLAQFVYLIHGTQP